MTLHRKLTSKNDLKDDFAKLITDCGFKFVNYKNLTNGVVAIHSGIKL